jgi:hypothetical protein
MRANVKPFTRWVIARGYRVRFQHREPQRVTGILTTPAGEVAFAYAPPTRTIHLPDQQIRIDEYGWEIKPTASV